MGSKRRATDRKSEGEQVNFGVMIFVGSSTQQTSDRALHQSVNRKLISMLYLMIKMSHTFSTDITLP